MDSDYIKIDPYDSNNLIIGDENRNLTFKSNQYIRFERNSIPNNDEGFINLALGESSGANIVVYNNDEERERDIQYSLGKLGYIKDTKSLIITIRELLDTSLPYNETSNPYVIRWKSIVSATIDDQTGQIVDLKYTQKNKNEEIEGTWTFKENTTFEKNVNANQVITDNIHSSQFHSGSNGWKLQDDSLEIENLTVRNKLKTNVFEIDKIKATNGTLYVSNCTTLTYVGDEPEVSTRGAVETPQSPSNDFTGVTKYVTFRENVFEVGDIIQCHNLNKNYKAIVLASNQILLESDPIGSPAIEDEVVKIDSTVESRNGTVLLTSDLNNAPYVDIKKGNVTKVRLGNLSGINDLSFTNNNINIEGYGLYANNAYITGKFILSNGLVLANYDDTSITTQVGNIKTTQNEQGEILATHTRNIAGLGSRITLTERKIESLVVDDGNMGTFNFVPSSDLDEFNEEFDYRILFNTEFTNPFFSSDNVLTINADNKSVINFDLSSFNTNSEKIRLVLVDTTNNLNKYISNKVELSDKGYFILNQNVSSFNVEIWAIYDADNIDVIDGYQYLGISLGQIKVYKNGVISEIRQTANDISLKVDNVENDLSATGIDIRTGQITVTSDNFKILNNNNQNTFSIDQNGNVKLIGTVSNPLKSVPLNELFIDLNKNNDYIDKNLQIETRVTDYSLTSYTGEILTIFLPGFNMIQNDTYSDDLDVWHRNYIDMYGNFTSDESATNEFESVEQEYGKELQIYHRFAPIYGLTAGDGFVELTPKSSSDNNDNLLEISTLILSDLKLSGEINASNNIFVNPLQISFFNYRNADSGHNYDKISSGWIVTNKEVVKGILLSPGYTAKLKSIYCDGFWGPDYTSSEDENYNLYHTNLWKLENYDEFKTISITCSTKLDDSFLILNSEIKLLVCKDIYNSNVNVSLTLFYITDNSEIKFNSASWAVN